MYLRHVEMTNFRAFRHGAISVPRTGLMLVAGANNSGKTALLSAFDAVAGSDGDVTSLKHGSSEGSARLTATFDLDDAERAAILTNATHGQSLLNAGAFSSIRLVFEQSDDLHLKARELLASWPGLEPQPIARFRASRAEDGPRYTVDIIGAFRQTEGQRDHPDQAVQLDANDLRVLKPALGVLEETDLLSVLGTGGLASLGPALAAWRSRFYHFRALRIGTQRSQRLSSPEKLDPSGSNLAGVLHNLATDRRGIFEQARALITQVVPGIGELNVLTGGDQMRVVFRTGHGDLNLKDLGTGVEQLLMTLVVGLTERAPFTLVVEEPETNLNPAVQRALLGFFKDWANDKLIIAATHSPVMVDWSPAGDRLWLVAQDAGASTVEPVSADPLPLLNALGVRLSDVLSADRLLVLEGPSDEDVLETWFPDVLRSPRVAVLRGRGGDNARHADQLAEWLAAADRAGPRRVLYLRDRDELAPEVLGRLEKSPSVHVLRRRELENYLLDPAAVADVIAAVNPGAQPPGTQAIAEAMASAAEALRPKIIVNRVARRVSPTRLLMDHELRQRLASDGADKAAFTDAVTERLMTAGELRAQIAAAWSQAEADVAEHVGEALLAIAPGEEVLDALFRKFAGTGYDKRVHGVAIAAAMTRPPELVKLLDDFMKDDPAA